jgi:hypothetical protein
VNEPTTIRIYGGADGDFTLYEDDGISLDYLEDGGTWTRFTWQDANRKLAIDPASPESVEPQPSRRTFRVEFFPSGRTETVGYAGQHVELALE